MLQSSNSKQLAVSLARQATISDNSGNPEEALEKYFDSMAHLYAAIKEAPTSQSRQQLKSLFDRYHKRAEEIKQQIGRGPQGDFKVQFEPPQFSRSLETEDSQLYQQQSDELQSEAEPEQSIDTHNILCKPETSPFENANMGPQLEKALSGISKYFRDKIKFDDYQQEEPQPTKPQLNYNPFEPPVSPFSDPDFQNQVFQKVKARQTSQRASAATPSVGPDHSRVSSDAQPEASKPPNQELAQDPSTPVADVSPFSQQLPKEAAQGFKVPSINKSQSITLKQLDQITAGIDNKPPGRPQSTGDGSKNATEEAKRQPKLTSENLAEQNKLAKQSSSNFSRHSHYSSVPQTVIISIDPQDKGGYIIELIGENKFKLTPIDEQMKGKDKKGKFNLHGKEGFNARVRTNWEQLRKIVTKRKNKGKNTNIETINEEDGLSAISDAPSKQKLQVQLNDGVAPKSNDPFQGAQTQKHDREQEPQNILSTMDDISSLKVNHYLSKQQHQGSYPISGSEINDSVLDTQIDTQHMEPQHTEHQHMEPQHQQQQTSESPHQDNSKEASQNGHVQQTDYEIQLDIIEALKWRYGLSLQKLESFVERDLTASDLNDFDQLRNGIDQMMGDSANRQSFKQSYPTDKPSDRVAQYFQYNPQPLRVRSDLNQIIQSSVKTNFYKEKLQFISQYIDKKLPQIVALELPMSLENHLSIYNMNEVVMTLVSDFHTIKSQNSIIDFGYPQPDDESFIPYLNQKSSDQIDKHILQKLSNGELFTGSPLILMFGQDGSEKNIVGRTLSQKIGGRYVFLDGAFLSELPVDLAFTVVKKVFDYVLEEQLDAKGKAEKALVVMDNLDMACKVQAETTSLEQSNPRNSATIEQYTKHEQLTVFILQQWLRTLNTQVITIVTATQPQVFHHVLLNTFQVAMYLKLPDIRSRHQYLKSQISLMSHNITDQQLQSIAERTENYNFVDMDYVLEQLYNEQINSLFEAQNLKQVKDGNELLWIIRESEDGVEEDQNQSQDLENTKPKSRQGFIDLVVAEQMSGFQLTFQPKQGYLYMVSNQTKEEKKFAILPPLTYNILQDKLKKRRPSGTQNQEFYTTFQKLMHNHINDKWYEKLDKFGTYIAQQCSFQAN